MIVEINFYSEFSLDKLVFDATDTEYEAIKTCLKENCTNIGLITLTVENGKKEITIRPHTVKYFITK
ncbi:hypothetical protein [Robertmurraya siralis]|uniref:hypothetical protein n=1 Tax=Robertmurraya siralis TaxID=77777 RepID=UPI0010F6F806|nr:hypothetical protein [Robertmurraya siralis]